MAKVKTGALLGWGLLIVGIGGVLFMPWRKVQAASGLGGGTAGGRYPTAGGPNTDATLFSQLLKSLQNLANNKGSAGKSSPFSAGPGSGDKSATTARAPLPASESIWQALWSGNTSIDQGVLAGIFNIQHGAADFVGDSPFTVGQGWLDNNGWNLGDLFASRETSIGGEQSLWSFTPPEYSVYNSGYDYADTVYGDYGAPQIDYQPYSGGYGGNYSDAGGSYGGFDLPEYNIGM